MAKKSQDAAVYPHARPSAANFATEKTKKPRIPSDGIEYDVMRAEQLGYGCHYGAYKADHPNTRDEYEALVGKAQKKVSAGKKEKTCPVCGITFVTGQHNKHKVYCTDTCRLDAEHSRKVERGPAKFCAQCGGEIPRGVRRTKFCSNACYHAAMKNKYNEGEERSAENGII